MHEAADQLGRGAYCTEHKGNFSGDAVQCAQCGAIVCHDCGVLLKKHQPCPVQHAREVDRMLTDAVQRALAFPRETFPQMYPGWLDV